MDVFKEVNKISVLTAVLSVLTIVTGFIATQMEDPITRVEVMIMAVVFLVLFFHSLSRDKISQLEGGKNVPPG